MDAVVQRLNGVVEVGAIHDVGLIGVGEAVDGGDGAGAGAGVEVRHPRSTGSTFCHATAQALVAVLRVVVWCALAGVELAAVVGRYRWVPERVRVLTSLIVEPDGLGTDRVGEVLAVAGVHHGEAHIAVEVAATLPGVGGVELAGSKATKGFGALLVAGYEHPIGGEGARSRIHTVTRGDNGVFVSAVHGLAGARVIRGAEREKDPASSFADRSAIPGCGCFVTGLRLGGGIGGMSRVFGG